jgi:hypothetical protein
MPPIFPRKESVCSLSHPSSLTLDSRGGFHAGLYDVTRTPGPGQTRLGKDANCSLQACELVNKGLTKVAGEERSTSAASECSTLERSQVP